jgi:hypothetical protein
LSNPANTMVLVCMHAALVAGCYGAQPGAQGRLAFSYATDDGPPDLTRPLAIGARLDLEVLDPTGGEALVVLGASSAHPDVIEVISITPGHVIVEARSPGSTSIRVTASRDGQVVADSIALDAAQPARVELGHACAGAEDGVYLTASRVLVEYDARAEDGAEAIGYGGVAIELEPHGALSVASDPGALGRSMRHLALHTAQSPTRATVRSGIGSSVLVLDLVGEETIDWATIVAAPDAVRTGDTDFVLAQPVSAGRGVCQGAPALEVIEKTPSTCHALPLRQLRDASYGWIQIDGLATGECRFVVRYVRAGVDVPFAIAIADADADGID